MSNYLSNLHDFSRPYDAASHTNCTDRTVFYTPYNQSVISKSNISQEKTRYQSQRPSKSKLTVETLREITKTENLTQILELNLDGNSRHMKNRLKIISGLNNLMNLRELNLSNNDIEKIENLNQLKNLHILNLSFNKITKIENISVLKQLEILNLSNNLIEEIPPIIVKNVNIFEINLANNMISEKTSILNLKSLPKMAILDLSNNPITEAPSYPTFIYHILKKLCTLDSKMTPNYVKAQNTSAPLTMKRQFSQAPNEEVSESPAFSYDYLANEQNEFEEENIQQSYEQRLMITQNRLNELSMLNKKVHLLNTEDLVQKPFSGNPFRKSDVDSKNQNFSKHLNERSEKTIDQDRSQFNQNASTNSFTNQQDKFQQQYGSIPSFVVNEHTLYSVSESGHDMKFKSNMMPDSKDNTLTYRNSNKDSNETQSTVSPMKRFFDIPSSNINEFRFSKDHNQPTPFSQSSNINLNHADSLNSNSSNQTPQEKDVPNWSQHILLKNVDKENDNIPQANQKYLENQSSDISQHAQQKIGCKIKEIQTRIEKRFSEYDRQASLIPKKKQIVIEIIRILDETLQNTLLSIKFRDESQISLLNEKSEILSKVGDLLELIDCQSENYMNFLFMLNQILAKLDENEKNIKIEANKESRSNDEIDERFNVSLKQIERISNKSKSSLVQILRIKEKVKLLNYSSPKLGFLHHQDRTNEKFESLYISFDELLQADELRSKTFFELKDLYTELWEAIKSRNEISRQQNKIIIDANQNENNSLSDFLFVSPKEKFSQSIALSSIEKDFNNSVSFKSTQNISNFVQNQIGKTKSPPRKKETKLSFNQALKTIKENIDYSEKSKTRDFENNEGFVFQSPSENGENTCRKDIMYSYPFKLEENQQKDFEKKEFMEQIPLIKACELCQSKENDMNALQDKLIKTEQDKANLEEEIIKLQAELNGVKKKADSQIKQIQYEFFHNSAVKESEKEIYSTALINLSDVCSNNSSKLDDIKLRIMSQSEQLKNDSLNPLQWLISLQTSTIEDVLKMNNDMQLQIKTLAKDFQNLLAIKEEQKTLSIAKFEEISAVTTQNQTLEIIDQKKESEDQKVFESIQLEDSKQPVLYSTNETIDPKNPHTSLLLRKKQDSLKAFEQKAEYNSNNSAEIREWKEVKKPLLKKASSDTDLQRGFFNSVEKSRQKPVSVLTERNNQPFHQYQFTLNMNNGNFNTVDPSSKENSKQNLCSNYLNQVLFGNNEVNSTEEQPENQNDTPLMTESDLNDYKSVSQEISYGLSGNYIPFQHQQFLTINGNALSNLQENIAQQLRQNEKKNAFQHLMKVQSNIHQYKSIRERVTEGSKRSSLKGNSATSSKMRGSETPTSKYPFPSTGVPPRRATLYDKNLNVPDNTKGYSSMRSTVGQTKTQLNYDNVFRKPSNYPTLTERGVKVNLKHFMSENKRALESPDIHIYNEKFDFESPYHPVNSNVKGHGTTAIKAGEGIFGMHINGPVVKNTGKSIDSNIRLRFSN